MALLKKPQISQISADFSFEYLCAFAPLRWLFSVDSQIHTDKRRFFVFICENLCLSVSHFLVNFIEEQVLYLNIEWEGPVARSVLSSRLSSRAR
jgi:hypothetical protein